MQGAQNFVRNLERGLAGGSGQKCVPVVHVEGVYYVLLDAAWET
jgi:hypothetical protein